MYMTSVEYRRLRFEVKEARLVAESETDWALTPIDVSILIVDCVDSRPTCISALNQATQSIYLEKLRQSLIMTIRTFGFESDNRAVGASWTKTVSSYTCTSWTPNSLVQNIYLHWKRTRRNYLNNWLHKSHKPFKEQVRPFRMRLLHNDLQAQYHSKMIQAVNMYGRTMLMAFKCR